MARLNAFNFISLDGYYKSISNDISWHRHGGDEEHQYGIDAMKNDGILLYGRLTYQMMAAYWASDMAMQNDPVMAKAMNAAEKIVFSNTLTQADWNNTLVVSNMVDEVKRLKQTSAKDMAILGSGSVITQLTDAGLIDEYQLMINPVVLGKGTPIFNGLKQPHNLVLTSTRTFKNGVVLLCYSPMQ